MATLKHDETTVKNLRFGVDTMTVALADGRKHYRASAWFRALAESHPGAARELEASRSRSRHPLARH